MRSYRMLKKVNDPSAKNVAKKCGTPCVGWQFLVK
jgi:hypothetical protein